MKRRITLRKMPTKKMLEDYLQRGTPSVVFNLNKGEFERLEHTDTGMK